MSLGSVIGMAAGFAIGFFIPGGSLVLGLALGSIGGAIGGYIDPITPDIPAIGAPLQELQITTNEIGLPIPDVLGTAKLTGNLLFYGGERSEAVTQEVGGGGKGGGGGSQTQVTGHRYYMSWALGICAGPIDEVLTIFRNEDVVWEGNTVRPGSGGEETIVIPDVGSVTFYFGTDDQAANAALGELMDDATLNTPYRGLCWAFFDDCYIGDYNRMPTMRFVLRKTPTKTFSEFNAIQTLDYNPAHAIWYILHEMAGLPETWLDEEDFEEMAAALYGESRGISLLMDSQQSVLNYLESINSHIDAIVRYGGDGKFHPKLIRDDYTVGDLPLIDETVVLDDPAFSRKSWIDTINEMKVQYSEITIERPGSILFWYIDDVFWTGAIVTVGAGKDYTTIRSAIYAATEDTLFLIYPGDYSSEVMHFMNSNYNFYFKGMGASYADVVVGWCSLESSSGIVFWEGVTFAGTGGGASYVLLWWAAFAGSFMANKSFFSTPGGYPYPVTIWGQSNWISPDVTLQNFQNVVGQCCFVGGATLDKIQIIKCVLPTHSKNSYCIPPDPPPLSGDYVIGATEGYGPDYGDFRIVQGPIIEGTGNDIKQSTANPAAVDIGNKEIQARVVSKTIQTALFTTNNNAVWAGVNALRKESYPFAVISFPANRNAFRLEVGDCFKFSYARYGVSNMICRILQISEDGPESETITVQAMEDIFSISNVITIFTTPADHAVPATDYTVLPFTHQKIIEAPYAISTTIKFLPIACRESDSDLGYDVYMSIDGGASYSFLQKITSLQPYGTLVGTYPDNTYKIDDDMGLTIDIEHGASLIETTTFDQVLAGLKNTALLGDEIISFQTITPVSGTQYKLEHIIRGRYDMAKASHIEGAEFYCLSSGLPALLTSGEFITGASRKFKFVPYNIKKSGAIADCTALTLTVEGRALTPYVPGNLCANGSVVAARYDNDIVLTWSPRYRGKGAGLSLPGTVLPEIDREGLYKIEVYVAAVLVRTTSAIDAATWTYTEAMNIADNGSPAAFVTIKVSNYRTEGGNTYESDQAEVTCKLN